MKTIAARAPNEIYGIGDARRSSKANKEPRSSRPESLAGQRHRFRRLKFLCPYILKISAFVGVRAHFFSPPGAASERQSVRGVVVVFAALTYALIAQLTLGCGGGGNCSCARSVDVACLDLWRLRRCRQMP